MGVNIPALNALAADPASADVLEIYDASAGENKKITHANLCPLRAARASESGGDYGSTDNATVTVRFDTLDVDLGSLLSLASDEFTVSVDCTLVIMVSVQGYETTNSERGEWKLQAQLDPLGVGSYAAEGPEFSAYGRDVSGVDFRQQVVGLLIVEATATDKIRFRLTVNTDGGGAWTIDAANTIVNFFALPKNAP